MRSELPALFALAALLTPLSGQDPDPPIQRESGQEPAQTEARPETTAASRVRAAIGCEFAILESKIRRSIISTDTPYGFKVAAVDAGSPADKAGVEAGWLLMEWEGRPIREIAQLDQWLWTVPAGGEVVVDYARKKKNVSIWSRHPWEDGEVTLVVRREHPLRADWGIDVFGPEDFERPEGAPVGVWVHGVVEGSAAARAGLRPGDVLRSCRGAVVADLDALREAVRDDQEAGVLELGIARQDDASEWTGRELELERAEGDKREENEGEKRKGSDH